MTHVLLITKEIIASVTLCGKTQLEYLAGEGKLEFRHVATYNVSDADISWADVIVFVRAADEMELYIARLCKKFGKPMVYVLDDDLFHLPDYISSAPYYNDLQIQSNMRTIMACCDTFLSPSHRLLEKYGPMFLNSAHIEEPSLVQNWVKKQPNGKVKIGFAGSIDRAEDLQNLLGGAIRRVLAERGDAVTFEFFGAKPALVDELGLNYIPHCEYSRYSETMERLNWDIALAPLPESEFHSCKYYNKYTEYAAFGIAGIFSAVKPYTRAIRDGENGILCENTEEAWYTAICRLIDDAELRQRISAAAQAEAEEKFSVPAVSEVWDNEISRITGGVHKDVPVEGMKKAKGFVFALKIKRKARKYGWRLPIVAIQRFFAPNRENGLGKRIVARNGVIAIAIYAVLALLFRWLAGNPIYRENYTLFWKVYDPLVLVLGVLLILYSGFLVLCIARGKSTPVLRMMDAFRKYRFLLRQLVARDFKTKYKRSVLGIFWSFLNPLLTMLVQYVVFSTLFQSDIQFFPLYLVIGIVCYNFFCESTSMALQSITGNATLITKVYVPKYIYPVSRVLSSGINLLLSLIPLFAVMVLSGVPFRWSLLLIPFALICLMAFCLGMGFILSTMMVFFRDTQFLWGVISMLWMYATPVFYPESIIPARFTVVFKCNPLYHVIRFIRICMMDGVSPEPKAYLLCAIACFVPLMVGAAVFKKHQDKFVLSL